MFHLTPQELAAKTAARGTSQFFVNYYTIFPTVLFNTFAVALSALTWKNSCYHIILLNSW